MREPIVCLAPTGNLWLLLDGVYREARWLNLETGEVRLIARDLNGLLTYGWKVFAGSVELRAF